MVKIQETIRCSEGAARSRPYRLGALLHVVAAGLIFACSNVAGAQQMPDPSDEAKLYENAKAEGGKVVYYSGQPAEQAAALAKRFQEKYPGVALEPIRLVGPVLYDRFTKERHAGKDIADVLYVADYVTMKQMIKDGMVAEWKVPTYDRLPEKARHGTHAYSVQFSDVVLAYNSNKVTPEEVEVLKQWKGVLDPRFKGRFGVAAHACGICYAGLQLFLTHPDYGEEFLRQVAAQQPLVYPNTVVALDRVTAGEADFVFWSFESAIIPSYLRGAPIRWLHPSPTPLFGSIIGVSDRAPHPNGARLFLNWLMGEGGAETILETGAMPVLEGIEDTRSFRKEPWYDPIKEVYEVDFVRWDTSYFDDLQIWSDILKVKK